MAPFVSKWSGFRWKIWRSCTLDLTLDLHHDFYFDFRVPSTTSHLKWGTAYISTEIIHAILALSLLHGKFGRDSAPSKDFPRKGSTKSVTPLTRPRHARIPLPSCAPPSTPLPASTDTQLCIIGLQSRSNRSNSPGTPAPKEGTTSDSAAPLDRHSKRTKRRAR